MDSRTNATTGSFPNTNARVPLPSGWFERFGKSLAGNPEAQRLLKDILSSCSVRDVCKMTMLYVRPPKELATERKKRGKAETSRLRKKARTLQLQLSSSVIIDPARHRENDLEETRNKLKRAKLAFDTRRMGIHAVHFAIFVIREYLQFRSGLVPTYPELAALAQAAWAAWNIPHKGIEPDVLGRNLLTFQKNSPHVRGLAGGIRSVGYVERPRRPA